MKLDSHNRLFNHNTAARIVPARNGGWRGVSDRLWEIPHVVKLDAETASGMCGPYKREREARMIGAIVAAFGAIAGFLSAYWWFSAARLKIYITARPEQADLGTEGND